MEFVVQVNQAQDDLFTRGGSPWESYFNTPQVLQIEVVATETADLKISVGLTQTLVSSTRRASYGDGVQLLQTFKKALPLLDGNELMVPWYNGQCQPQKFKAIGDHFVLKLEDAPQAYVPGQAVDANGQTRDITGLSVAEEFLVTLYDEDASQKIFQWGWAYSYELAAADNDYKKKPIVVTFQRSDMEAQDPMQAIKLDGPVANDEQAEDWTPGWKGVSHN